MRKEIKRSDWSRFCRRFSSSNLLRPARVEIQRRGEGTMTAREGFPLIGLSLHKKGRFIDSLAIVAGQPREDAVALPIVQIQDPAEVILEQSQAGQDQRLRLKSKDGTVAVVELAPSEPSDAYDEFRSQVAYSLYESRGHRHGDDWSDWFEADRRLRQTIEQYT